MNTPISDLDILNRLKAGEDSFVERKSLGDWKKDAVKTCVAFANSCPENGGPGLLCIGVRDDGRIEAHGQNLDKVQLTLEQKLATAYPTIDHHTKIVSTHEGKFLAVVVPGSAKGPHFSGPAYIRVGSKIEQANKDQFERLVDMRQRKVREILKWRGRGAKLVRTWVAPTNMSGRIAGYVVVTIVDCDAFVVKVKNQASSQISCFSLENVVIGFDPVSNCLKLEVPQD